MPERKNVEKLYYTENQTIPNQLEYPILGAAGGNARSKKKTSYYRPNEMSLEELINATASQGQLGSEFGNKADSSGVAFGNINRDPDQKNEILGIPSFLVYPEELGKNRRYKHFILLNIYQGTSDSVRLNTRTADQVNSSILAKGGVKSVTENQVAGLSNQDAKRTETIQTLKDAGFDTQQAILYANAIGKGNGVTAGFIEDERLGIVNLSRQGAASNSQGSDSNILDRTIDFTYGVAGGVYDAGAGVVDFFSSYLEAANRDNLAEANKNPRNYNRKGASGRNVYRAKQDQNVLLANRRFNNANVKSKDTICLYMPQKISMNDQLVYSEEEMGTSKMVLDAISGKGAARSALLEKIGRKGVADVVGSIAQTAAGIAGPVGSSVSESIGEVNANALRAAQQRSTQNPRREMMFKDVATRTHNFSFDFVPRNEAEAETVLNIIRMLRYHAYPGLQSGGGHFFTFPAEFELTFYTIEEPSGLVVINDNLPMMPRLALQSIAVDYSAAGDFKTFVDSKPAFIRLELGFQEMEQLTNEHIVHGY